MSEADDTCKPVAARCIDCGIDMIKRFPISLERCGPCHTAWQKSLCFCTVRPCICGKRSNPLWPNGRDPEFAKSPTGFDVNVPPLPTRVMHIPIEQLTLGEIGNKCFMCGVPVELREGTHGFARNSAFYPECSACFSKPHPNGYPGIVVQLKSDST